MVRGDLSIFPLLPLMQMLLGSGRSGRLSLGHLRGGDLWLAPGELVHAEAGALQGEVALELLCSVDGGLFTFETVQPPPERTLNLRRDAALTHMFEVQESWGPLLQDFSDWDRTLSFTTRWTEAQPVTQAQYQTLSLLRPGQTVAQLVGRAGQPPRQLLGTLRPFLNAGMIELS